MVVDTTLIEVVGPTSSMWGICFITLSSYASTQNFGSKKDQTEHWRSLEPRMVGEEGRKRAGDEDVALLS